MLSKSANNKFDTKQVKENLRRELLESDTLMIIECWARDNFTPQEIADKLGINVQKLLSVSQKEPRLRQALRNGKEFVDYKVESALLKAALGYKTKEVKTITTIRRGKVVETLRETTIKDVAPQASMIQMWLHNRRPDKWRRNTDTYIGMENNDEPMQIVITRASHSPHKIDGDELNDEVEFEIQRNPEKKNVTGQHRRKWKHDEEEVE